MPQPDIPAAHAERRKLLFQLFRKKEWNDKDKATIAALVRALHDNKPSRRDFVREKSVHDYPFSPRRFRLWNKGSQRERAPLYEDAVPSDDSVYEDEPQPRRGQAQDADMADPPATRRRRGREPDVVHQGGEAAKGADLEQRIMIAVEKQVASATSSIARQLAEEIARTTNEIRDELQATVAHELKHRPPAAKSRRVDGDHPDQQQPKNEEPEPTVQRSCLRATAWPVLVRGMEGDRDLELRKIAVSNLLQAIRSAIHADTAPEKIQPQINAHLKLLESTLLAMADRDEDTDDELATLRDLCSQLVSHKVAGEAKNAAAGAEFLKRATVIQMLDKDHVAVLDALPKQLLDPQKQRNNFRRGRRGGGRWKSGKKENQQKPGFKQQQSSDKSQKDSGGGDGGKKQ